MIFNFKDFKDPAKTNFIQVMNLIILPLTRNNIHICYTWDHDRAPFYRNERGFNRTMECSRWGPKDDKLAWARVRAYDSGWKNHPLNMRYTSHNCFTCSFIVIDTWSKAHLYLLQCGFVSVITLSNSDVHPDVTSCITTHFKTYN